MTRHPQPTDTAQPVAGVYSALPGRRHRQPEPLRPRRLRKVASRSVGRLVYDRSIGVRRSCSVHVDLIDLRGCTPWPQSKGTQRRMRHLHSTASDSSDGTRARATCRSTSSIAACATRTCTPFGMNGEGTQYPCVPGHEIVGRVTRVGAEVKGFKTGDLAGVGCLVDSCGTCAACHDGLEQYCQTGHGAHLQQSRQTPGRRDLRRLFHADRRGRVVRPAGLGETAVGERGPAPLRRYHDLLAAPALEGRARTEGRHRRPRWPGPHGPEVLARVRRAHRAVHHVAREGR